MKHESDDLDTNTSNNESLAEVLARGLSRRTFLKGSLSLGAVSIFSGGEVHTAELIGTR